MNRSPRARSLLRSFTPSAAITALALSLAIGAVAAMSMLGCTPKPSPAATMGPTTPGNASGPSACPPETSGTDGAKIPRALVDLMNTGEHDRWVTLGVGEKDVTPDGITMEAGRLLAYRVDRVDLSSPDLAARIEKATGHAPNKRGEGKEQKLIAQWGEHVLVADGVGTPDGALAYVCRLDGAAFTLDEAKAIAPELVPTGLPNVALELMKGQPITELTARVAYPHGGEVEASIHGNDTWRTALDPKLRALVEQEPLEFNRGDTPGKSFIREAPPGWKIDLVHDKAAGITHLDVDWTND